MTFELVENETIDNDETIGKPLVDSPCEDCSHVNICKYTDNMKSVINSIATAIKHEMFVSGISINCKFKTSNIIQYKPGVRDIEVGLEDKIVTKVTNEPKSTPRVYATGGPSEMVVKYDPKEAITSGLEDHISNSDANVTKTNLGVTMEDGTSRAISSSSKTRKSKPAMPKPIPQSQAEPQVVNAVLLTVPDDVPVQSVNLDDVPEQYRASIIDNTVTEPTPGQTTNI